VSFKFDLHRQFVDIDDKWQRRMASFDARCAIGGFLGTVGANIRCAYRNSLPRCSRSGDELEQPAFRWNHLKANEMLEIQRCRASFREQSRVYLRTML
jgi:hypothetical protein